jgi:hypothetical protein
MNYKKILVGFALFFCALFVSWKIFSIPSQSKQSLSSVNVTINTGISVATYDGIIASSVFDALAKVSENKKIQLKTKHYDFGVFVEKIGDLVNTKDKAWIYSVNGKSGDVAADKKMVKTGDSIEWLYTKPMY